MILARNNQWDYEQGFVFGLGTAKSPELFRININTKGNTISQEDFEKLENKLVKVADVVNTALSAVCKLVISVRKPYDPDASVDDEDFE
jgi:hypothetical protein